MMGAPSLSHFMLPVLHAFVVTGFAQYPFTQVRPSLHGFILTQRLPMHLFGMLFSSHFVLPDIQLSTTDGS
jgi:hypothetical protein